MSKTIAVANHKGGVGKTTSAVNIGAALALHNKRTLLVDLDQQKNLTQSLGVTGFEVSIYDALRGNAKPELILVKENLFVIPACVDLAAIDLELASEPGREFILRELLSQFTDDFDFILLDCPPSMGLLTVNALVAADEYLIPLQAHFLALKGVGKLLEVEKKIRSRLNPNLKLCGVLLTQFDSRKILNRDVKETINEHFGEKLLKTQIRNNIALAEAPSVGQDIFSYAPDSNGAADYMEIAKQLLLQE